MNGAWPLGMDPIGGLAMSEEAPAIAVPPLAASPTCPVTTPGARPLRVLVAEDSQIGRIVLAGQLKGAGVDLHCVADGYAALTCVLAAPPDLILMDVQMPGMDGIAATRAIRQWERERHRSPIPIYAMTAHATSDARGDCLSAGMTGVLGKPLLREEISGLLAGLQADGRRKAGASGSDRSGA